MDIEHLAFNVADPVAIAAWYGEHLGLTVALHVPGPAETHFLADSSGQTVLEIYHNPPDQVPDYAAMNPLLFHVAFVSEFPPADSARLIAAGASQVDEIQHPDGTHIIMMRDPWGLALQLCKRPYALVRKA